MALKIACSCGRTFNVPERKAGQKIGCLYCGKQVTVPENEDALPVLEEEGGAAPADRSPPPKGEPSEDEEPILALRGASPFPAVSIALGILAMLDAVLVAGLSALVVVGSLFISKMGEQMAEEEAAVERYEERAKAFTDRVKASGGNVLLNENATGPGPGAYRKITYTTVDGTKKVELLYLGREPDRTSGAASGTSGKQVQTLAGLAFGISMALILVCFAKVISGIGFFLRRNWGRVGLMGSCGIEIVVGFFAFMTPVAWFVILPSMLLNVFVLYFFRQDDVQGAAPY